MLATALISTLGGLVADWLNNKREEKNNVHKAKMQRIANDQQWDLAQAEAAASSWKDEWFVILLSVPLVATFIGYHEEVERGFKTLEAMPDYYKMFLAAAVAASFGMKSLAGVFKK